MNNQSVLIIDRDRELAQIVGSFLNLFEVRVTFAGRVSEAFVRLDSQKFSCIFLDPDLGLERGEKILLDISGPGSLNHKTPVILSSANGEYAMPLHAIKQVKGVIKKPFDLESLYSCFSKVMPMRNPLQAPN